ncbi:MAG: lipopolysaccharide heptosyltransferase II [Methyloversatilis sp.]|nr:lipopolysaccharide heptosyltransferase II [Methyloversatilis sp.]
MKRILIVRTSAIGDVVFASPLAAAIKRTYPHAYLAWLVEPGIAPLIAEDRCLDAVITWPKAEWKQLWREGRRLELWRRARDYRAQLRSHRFDTVLDLQGLLKSGLLAWLTGAPRRVGLGSKEGSRLFMTEVVERGGDPARISSEYLHLARHLDLDCGEFLPRLVVSDAVQRRAREMMARHGLAPRAYVACAPFTTRPQKHWFEDAWSMLCARLIERGLTPVLLGGPADVEAAARIAATHAGIVNLAGITRLPEAAALIGDAALLVGVDTGLTHMGTAMNTPTVALFGSTCPYTVTGRDNARVIWLGLDCSPCRRHPTCGGAYHCLRDITPERVLDVAGTLLPALA